MLLHNRDNGDPHKEKKLENVAALSHSQFISNAIRQTQLYSQNAKKHYTMVSLDLTMVYLDHTMVSLDHTISHTIPFTTRSFK
jgi:hypothetical protein